MRSHRNASDPPYLRVLVVEDDPDVRTVTRAGLEQFGFGVDEADGCMAALGQLADPSLTYAAVVVDLGLPDGDGATVVRYVVRTRPGTAVVVASGSHAERLPPTVVAISKPYTPTMLAGVILQAIGAAESLAAADALGAVSTTARRARPLRDGA